MVVRKGCIPEISFLHIQFGDVFKYKDCLYMKVDMQNRDLSDREQTLAVLIEDGKPMYIKNECLVTPIKCELLV